MTSRLATLCERWRGGARLFGALAFVNGMFIQHAFADEPLDLRWDAPAECPQVGAVEQQVRALAGEIGQRKVSVRAEGRIEATGARYRLTLLLRDGDRARKRVIYSESCVDLAGAAAVTLGLFLRDEAASSAPTADIPTTTSPAATSSAATSSAATSSAPPEPAPADTPEATPEPPTVPNEPPEPRPAPNAVAGERHWHVLLRAPLGVVDFGLLPRPGLALGLAVGVRYDAWRLVALGSMALDRRVPSIVDAVAAKVALKRTELGLCHGWRNERVELAPCVTLAFDHLTISGTGVGVSPRSRHTSLFELGASAVAHLYLADWLAIVASAGAGVRTSQPRIIVDGFGQVYQVRSLRAGFSLGSEWIF